GICRRPLFSALHGHRTYVRRPHLSPVAARRRGAVRPLITRRDFTAGLLLADATRAAWAQLPAKQHLIVFVFGPGPTASWRENRFWQPFFSELRRLGYVEGNNLAVEAFSADGHFERYTDLAHQAVSRSPDVIVAGENPLLVALRSATGTIPIVSFS